MSIGRAPEDEQIEMFDLIDLRLRQAGLKKYEVSNYAVPGYESKHNMTYWNDRDYWGLGLSAHSYFTNPEWGVRFWNPKSFEKYEEQLNPRVNTAYESLDKDQRELLSMRESLTDYCHMAFRQPQGLRKDAAQKKFGFNYPLLLEPQLNKLKKDGMILEDADGWRLAPSGDRVLNQILLELCF